MTAPNTTTADVPRIFAIDPGTESSGWVDYCGRRITACGEMPNEQLLSCLPFLPPTVHLAIEVFEPRGMGVGMDSIETIIWTGRFIQQWHCPDSVIRVKRSTVKSELCGSQRATDSAVRAVLIDMWGPGKSIAIGKKKTPGPLFEVSGHAWQALGVAVTAEVKLNEQYDRSRTSADPAAATLAR
jgi:hypothetical protein